MKTKIQGQDVCIETSLKEYGLAWIERETEFMFFYGTQYDGESYSMFDWSTVTKGVDLKSEYNWMDEKDWQSVFSFVGMSEKDWFDMDLTNQISDLFSYSGFENLLVSSYCGYTYSEVRFLANRISWRVKS